MRAAERHSCYVTPHCRADIRYAEGRHIHIDEEHTHYGLFCGYCLLALAAYSVTARIGHVTPLLLIRH